MRRFRTALIFAGLLAAGMGLLWIGQGLGYITWPASSFMIGQRTWVDYGAGLAVMGLLLVLAGRRIR